MLPYDFVALDRAAFHLINSVWTHPFLDVVMPVITDFHKVPWFIYGVVPVALGLWLWKCRARALRVLVVTAIAMGVCDLLAYRIVKPLAARPRPERVGIGALIRVPSGGVYGFPSNHATNMGSAAAVLSVAHPGARFVFWGGAATVAYSRVYCGGHYPLDVLAGLALGGLLSWPWALLMLGGGKGGSKKKRR